MVVDHPTYGPALPGLHWVPAPRYVLRRDRVFWHLRDISPGKVLDIGCGPAALISELAACGHETVGVDSSPQALELGQHLQSRSSRMALHSGLNPEWKGQFDLVLSFEVIEHIDDDVAAMREWRTYLKPGGRMIVSTPAHARRWNAADEWAGHVRRYEKDQLIRAVQAAGFEVQAIECYGFPLANVMEWIRAQAYGRKLATEKAQLQVAELTGESGSDRSIETRFWSIYSSVLPSLVMRLFCRIQRAFLKTEAGNGYILIAKAA